MIDILYLAHRRREFTAASLTALLGSVPWALARLLVYTDGDRFEHRPDVMVSLNEERHGGPVAVMNHYLMKVGASDVFAKIDNDAITPPGWLMRSLAVMTAHPELDLLGIEPPSSTIRVSLANANGKSYAPCDSIGGIGLMRRRAFAGRDSMIPRDIHGGFTSWQLAHADVVKGWISPPLDVFLLDRLPIEPWSSLSHKYISSGEQRAWKTYSAADAHLWSWWGKVPVA